MNELTPEQIAWYHHRSYAAVDGLWFLKVEERYGFDTALEIDSEVWRIMPKIQLRMLKKLMGFGNGMDGLFPCVNAKLTLEGFTFKAEKNGDGFTITVEKCPWHETMVRSGREALSGRVGSLICNTEFPTFASEFDKSIRFELKSQLCKGSDLCIMQFSR